MSKATKRKHVVKEVLRDEMKGLGVGQRVVRVVEGRGNNLHLVREPDGSTEYLVSMPTKFRRNVWVKRGDYLVVEPIPEGDKVRAEIARILDREYIRYLASIGEWPVQFDSSTNENIEDFVNDNRPNFEESTSSSSEED